MPSMKHKIWIIGLVMLSISIVFIPREYACATSGKIPMESDSSENLFAAWGQKNNNTESSNIFASIKPSGGSWSTPQQISGSCNKCADPIVEVAQNGNTIIMWMATLECGNNALMVATIESVFGSWSTDVMITSTVENVVNDWYNVEITGEGVTAIWSAYLVEDGTGALIKVMRTAFSTFGGAWSAPSTIS